MKMKCLGGELDGQWRDVTANRIGEHVRFHKQVNFKLSDFNEDLEAFRNNKSPQSTTVSYVVYRIAVFCFDPDDRYKFLVPEGWTDKQALLHQIEDKSNKLKFFDPVTKQMRNATQEDLDTINSIHQAAAARRK